MTTYSVEIVERKTNISECRQSGLSKRKATKVKKGMEINLNKEKYFVRIWEETTA